MKETRFGPEEEPIEDIGLQNVNKYRLAGRDMEKKKEKSDDHRTHGSYGKIKALT